LAFEPVTSAKDVLPPVRIVQIPGDRLDGIEVKNRDGFGPCNEFMHDPTEASRVVQASKTQPRGKQVVASAPAGNFVETSTIQEGMHAEGQAEIELRFGR